MPLIRDWTDSLTVDALDAHGERFFTRLLMKVDDYGRTLADGRFLKSRLFPLKTDIRETDISRWLAACQKAGLLRFYVDGRGRTILEVFKYGQRKKFMRSEYDPPEDQQFLPLAPPKKVLAPVKEVEVEGKRRESAPPPDSKIKVGALNGDGNRVVTSALTGARVGNEVTSSGIPRLLTSAPTKARESWQLLKDERELKARLDHERESTAPDPAMITALRGQLRTVREHIKGLKS